jgi:hypothetical protein
MSYELCVGLLLLAAICFAVWKISRKEDAKQSGPIIRPKSGGGPGEGGETP